MTIQEKIEKQINAGFTYNEIYSNLQDDGYSKEEINSELQQSQQQIKTSNKSNTKAILLGSLMLLVVVFRLARFSSGNGAGSVFAVISIVTGLILAILYFAKKS